MSDVEVESFLPKEQEARREFYKTGETPEKQVKSRDWWVTFCFLNVLIVVLLYLGYRFNHILEEKNSDEQMAAENRYQLDGLKLLLEKSTAEVEGKFAQFQARIKESIDAKEVQLPQLEKPFKNDLNHRDMDSGHHAYVQFITEPDQIMRPIVSAKLLWKVNTKADYVIVTLKKSNDGAEKNSYAQKMCEEIGCKHVELDPTKLEIALENCPECPLEKYLGLLGYGFTEYSKVAILANSVFPLSNIDDIFTYRSPAAACSENNWFEMRSGILVLKPSEEFLGDVLKALHDHKRIPDSGFLAEDEDGWGDKDGGSSFLSSWLEYSHIQWTRLHPGWNYPWDKIKTGGSWYYFVWRKQALRTVDFVKDTIPWRDINGNRLGDYERAKHAAGRMTASEILKLWWGTLVELLKEHPSIIDILKTTSPRFDESWFKKALEHNDIGYPQLPPWPLDLSSDEHKNWAIWSRENGKSG